MRVRTIMALSTGAALGAGCTYLLDPAHGEQRRRVARRDAVRALRQGAARAAADTRRRGAEMAVSAAAGYRETRGTTPDAPIEPTLP